MLGPVHEMLVRSDDCLPLEFKREFEVVNRNGRRLLKLVNNLLEFSRIEAGRVQATFECVDLPAFTAELASAFRSICEQAG